MWTKMEKNGTKEPNNFGVRRTSFVNCCTFCLIPWGHQIQSLFMFGMDNWKFQGLLESLSNSQQLFSKPINLKRDFGPVISEWLWTCSLPQGSEAILFQCVLLNQRIFPLINFEFWHASQIPLCPGTTQCPLRGPSPTWWRT